MTSSSSDGDFHVTFNLPSSAAALLKELADGGNQGLRDLGVVSVQINSPAFREGCTASSRKYARESEVPLSANTSHLDKLSLSCHSFPSQDDLENTRQNIRHYLTMRTADTGNVDYVIPHSSASAPTQPLDMPRHIPDMRPVNPLGHPLSFTEASQVPVSHRLDPARSLVSETDHGHQKRNADAESSWKPPCSSYWNWQQNHYRLSYADVAVDGYGPHSGLARPVSPMYARSPPYAFNPCSPRLRTGYQMLPPSHFQEPFAHLENERAWQHTSHTTSPYLMNLLHSNSSHAAKNQRLAGPFETVLALPPGQTKKKFHRSRKDVVALTRSGAMDSSNAGGSGSTYDGPGTLNFGPDQSSFAFPLSHNVCRPDSLEQNQRIYAAAQSTYVNKSQANSFSAPSHIGSTSCLVTSPPAIAMPTSAHVATTAAYVRSSSESVMLTPAHAMLTTAGAMSTSHVILTSECSESPRAPDISAAIDKLIPTSTNLMSSSAHAVSTPALHLPTSNVFLTSAHVMSAPQHLLCTSTHGISLPKDVFTVPLCHTMSSSLHSFSDSNAITKPVPVAAAPSLGSASPALAISTVKQTVAIAAAVATTREIVTSPLTHLASARISSEFSEQQYFRSNYFGSGSVASDECRPAWSSKSKIQDDCSIRCSLKETSTNLNTSSHAEQVCNGELEKLPDLTQRISETKCLVGKNSPLAILPTVGIMEMVHKDQGLISRIAELKSAREGLSARCVICPVQGISNETNVAKAIISRKPDDAEPKPCSAVTSLIYNSSSAVDRILPDALASSVSSSLMNEMTFIDSKGSISSNVVSQSPMSLGTLQETKPSLRGQVLEIVDHGKEVQKKSDENSVSVSLPSVISNTGISEKAEDEMRIGMHVVADNIPTSADNGQARLQHVDIVVQENLNSEKTIPDTSQADVTSKKQSVCNATDTTESLTLVMDTVAPADSADGSNGIVHEKRDSLEVSVNVGQAKTDCLQNDEYSQEAVDRSFQTKFDENFSNDMRNTVDGVAETSSCNRVEQLKCNNGKDIRGNVAASSNGVESVDATQMLFDNGSVCSITTANAPQLPMNTVKTTINTSSSPKENVSSVVLRNADDRELAGDLEIASRNCYLLDGNMKLAVGRQTKNCTDDNDDKVMGLVGSEQGAEEGVQSAHVNLRLQLIRDELVQKVSHSVDECTSRKKSNVPISGDLCSVPVLHHYEEYVQKATYSDGSHSPRASASKEVVGLSKPCIVDGRSSQSASSTTSEDGQKDSVGVEASFSCDDSSMDPTRVLQYAKSPVTDPSTSEIRTPLHSKVLPTSCNALLPTASMSQISSNSDLVMFDKTVSEQKCCSDQMQPRELSNSAECDISAVRHAGTSCQGAGIQPNGLIAELNASPEVLNFSDSHPSELLRTVVPSRTVSGFPRHCVADVASVKSCSAETVSTFALNSPLRKEVSLSSEILPSLPLLCLTAKREDELSDRERSYPVNCSSGLNEASSAMHSEVLHSDSKTVSPSVAPVAESSPSVSVEMETSATKSTSHSCVRQSPVACTTFSEGDHVSLSKEAKLYACDEDVLSRSPPAKRLRTSDAD